MSYSLANNKKMSNKSIKSMPCQYFNQRSCLHYKSDDTEGNLYKHICAACFATNGKTFPHPEVEY